MPFSLLRILKTWLIFSELLAIVIVALQKFLPFLLFRDIWVFFFFFVFLMPIIFVLAMEGIRRGGPESALIILGANVVKMIISLILAGYYILNFHIKSLAFAFDFFLLYILFTVFEIHCLLHNLRVQKKDNNSSNK